MNVTTYKSLFCLIALLCGLITIPSMVLADEQAKTDTKEVDPAPDYIAIVGGEEISMRDYVGNLRKGMRDKFYHGKAPEKEIKMFRKEMAEKLVARQLAIQEAKRRGIKPDSKVVQDAINRVEQKYKDDPEWVKAREKVIAQLKEKFEGDSLAEKLKQQVRSIPEPSKKQLQAYYNGHKNLFTTPERVKVSLILLKVDPSSPSEVWQQASEEANTILERINKGGDFADLARIHSGDASASNGGDMGYVHSGMLGTNAQQVLSIMEPGEISSPVVLLEGVALFRLDDRVKPSLNPLKDVKERAVKLYQRENGEKAWEGLMAKLKAETKIEYNDLPWR